MRDAGWPVLLCDREFKNVTPGRFNHMMAARIACKNGTWGCISASVSEEAVNFAFRAETAADSVRLLLHDVCGTMCMGARC